MSESNKIQTEEEKHRLWCEMKEVLANAIAEKEDLEGKLKEEKQKTAYLEEQSNLQQKVIDDLRQENKNLMAQLEKSRADQVIMIEKIAELRERYEAG